jgi:hypothetical protein
MVTLPGGRNTGRHNLESDGVMRSRCVDCGLLIIHNPNNRPETYCWPEDSIWRTGKEMGLSGRDRPPCRAEKEKKGA